MKYLVLLLLVVSGWLPALAADPAEGLKAFEIIVRRNVFDSKRMPMPTAAGGPVAAPVTPTETMTLVGVVVLAGRADAVLNGSGPELSGTRHVGDTIGPWRLTAVDTQGVSLSDATGTLRLAVGATLARSPGQPWQTAVRPVVEAPPGGPAAAATTTEAAGPAAPGGSADDILKRMRERRQRELNP